jgi:hypothetical protein
MEPSILTELRYIFDYLSVPSNRWEISIGHIIDRDPSMESAGDASFDACGALSEDLAYWFDGLWSAELRRRLHVHHKDIDYIHINVLEFITLVVQMAATVTRVEDSPKDKFPPLPVLLSLTDNKSAEKWAQKVSASSWRGQKFVSILAELLRRSDIGFNTDFIPGKKNILPDYISRPPTNLSHLAWREQIFKTDKRLKSWDCFLPSPEFVSLLASRLYSNVWQGPPKLPSRLGRFVPASSTTCSSFTL